MRRVHFLAISALILLVLCGRCLAQIPKLEFEKYHLPNGLQVILHQDHSTPIVAVNIWYHVGSKNERPGRTGFAHLFEHMMFQGSKHYDHDYFLPLQQAGGQINGSTSNDRTNYWENVPSNYLDLALWMESDRMAFLLPAMTQRRLDNQRSVVKNERRQGYENRPYGLAHEVILSAMFPADYPYSWPVIGSMADLEVASREDIADFFRHYYHPGNASLCIAGDIQPAEAKRLVEKYFGPVPAGPKVEKLQPIPVELEKSQRIQMTDRVGLARLYLNWLSVAEFAPDDADLETLGDVLAGGKTSRLYRRLVRDLQIAQDVQAGQMSMEIGGTFAVIATARPGHPLAELEKAIMEEVGRIQAEPPAGEEVARVLAQRESHMVRALEPLGGFGGRADQLNRYNVLTGDPGYLTKDFARYQQVAPADVQRVAKKYLTDKFVALEIVPGAETTITPDPRIAAAEARTQLAKEVKPSRVAQPGTAPEGSDREGLPKPGPEPKFDVPTIHRGRLPDGLRLMVVEYHKLPVVHLRMALPFGEAAEPADKLGLARLTAAVWDEGTKCRTSDQIAEELALLGTALSIGCGLERSSATMFCLKGRLAKALNIYADVLLHPTFPEDELQRQRNMAVGRLFQIRNDPLSLANMAVDQVLYGYDHPYGEPHSGAPGTLTRITRDDLLAFYQAHCRPEGATLIAVGDITLDELTKAVTAALVDWKAQGEAAGPKLPPVPPAKPTAVTLVDKSGAAQSVISVALVGPPRKSPDYFPLVVMNAALGGQFASRLNMNLREDKGFTYGARSAFQWHVQEPGPYMASSSVQTAVTAPALTEFIAEFEGISGVRPVEGDELDFCKKYITRGFPQGFDTPGGVAGQLATLVEFDLPDDYFSTVVPKVNAVTTADIVRAAKKCIDLGRLAVIIVGDRAQIEASLRELPIGKNLTVVRFDDDFKLGSVK